MDLVEDYRHTPENQAIYAQRKETVERVFADAEEKHGITMIQRQFTFRK